MNKARELEALVVEVNAGLENGKTIADIERKHGIHIGTLRKRINRANYKLDRNINQYVLLENTGITQEESDIITHTNTQGNTEITRNKRKASSTKVTQDNTFTDDEVAVLKMIINNYRSLELEGVKLEGKITTRSFRSYEEVMDKFVKFCKDNKLSQKDAFAQALMDFMTK